MRKPTLTLFLLGICILLLGCNKFEERKAEKAIHKYYEALIKDNYEAAFQELYLYDDNFLDGTTSLSNAKAKDRYLEKAIYLQEQQYKVNNFDFKEVEYEDGHSFWHRLTINVNHDGETSEYEETVFYKDGKLILSGNDPYITYRDGKMTNNKSN